MKAVSKANTERVGVYSIGAAFSKMGHIFREQTVSDYGIDAHVEIVKDGKATGRLIAVQIKSGNSWFSDKSEIGVIFRGDMAHLEYWLNHSLPVIVVLYDPDSETAYWQVINNDTVSETGKGWKIEIPFGQTVEEASKKTFEELAGTPVSTKGDHTILSLRDVSHGNAKRYSANILVPESSTNTEIYQVIREVSDSLKHREYYRSDLVKRRWKGKSAQVIFLFIYRTLDDVRITNWICRSLWIDENLPPQFAPFQHDGEDIGDNIVVDWSKHYKLMQRIREQHSLTKEDYLAELEAILKTVTVYAEKAIRLMNDHNSGVLNSKEYAQEMKKLEPDVTELYIRAGDIGLAPLECKDLSERFQTLMASVHNIVLPFSERGLKTWEERNRKYLVDRAIEEYQKNMIRLEFEWEKVR